MTHPNIPNLHFIRDCRPCNFYCSCCRTTKSRCISGEDGWFQSRSGDIYDGDVTAIICHDCLKATQNNYISQYGCDDCAIRLLKMLKEERLHTRSVMAMMIEMTDLHLDTIRMIRDFLVPCPENMKKSKYEKQTFPQGPGTFKEQKTK